MPVEYMTGGVVVILGKTGRNFAAGMSGGTAYVLDKDHDFAARCNEETVFLEEPDEKDLMMLKEMLEKHAEHTSSSVATMALINWERCSRNFVKVMPMDYKKMLQSIDRAVERGLHGEEAINAAFEENTRQGGH